MVCGVTLSWLVREFAVEAFEVGAFDTISFEIILSAPVAEFLVSI